MKTTKTQNRARYWLGISATARTVFPSPSTPTQETHGAQFAACVGPFRTKRGAEFMRDHGRNNPHCQCVNDAEHIARGEAYDIVLRKWVKRAAR